MHESLTKILIILVCFLLPLDNITVCAIDTSSEPPAYMRELSRLVAATASEDDFGEIKLTVGEPEMEVDGETQPITDDGYTAPFMDENGEVQIPAVLFDDVQDEVGAVSPAELEEKGYEVRTDIQSGSITVTEPYGLCRLIVKTQDGKVRNSFGATHEIHVSNNRTVLQYADKAAAEQAAVAFAKEKDILFCEPDGFCTISSITAEAAYKCWGTKAVGADQFMATLPNDLPQVTVAVIDTGVDLDHPFLEGRLLDGGWDFVGDDDDPDDEHDHGTHCSGIIRDATPDNVKILPIRILDAAGSGQLSIIAEGITYAADCGADILSMSFGGPSDSQRSNDHVLSDAIAYALSVGATPVAAAGNEGANLDTFLTYPACCDGVITVAATEKSDFAATYSNYGSKIDVAAPGSEVFSSVRDGKFDVMSGTSMACPLVAACAALLKSEDLTRTTDDLRTLLRTKTRDAQLPGRDDHVGSGIVYLGEKVPLQSVVLSTEQLEMEALSTVQMSTPQFVPQYRSDCCVTFESSDPSVVIAEATGRIHAVRSGTAEVIVYAADAQQSVCTVSVYGSEKIQIEDRIYCSAGRLLLSGDGMAWAYGYSPFFGCYTGSVDGSPFRFQSAPGEVVTDIDRYMNKGFLKRDGTFWINGTHGLRDHHVPIMAVKEEDGSPLMGVVMDFNNLVWLEDGTVWYYTKMNEPAYRPLCTADGKVLKGVVPPTKKDANLFLITQGGWAYQAVQVATAAGKNNYGGVKSYGNPAPFYAEPVTDTNGYPLCNVKKINAANVLYNDGRLVRRSTDEVILTDVQTFVGASNNPYGSALKKDGTVWYMSTGEQIMKADGTPLTDVCSIQDLGMDNYNVLCADGTIWAWGNNGVRGSDSQVGRYLLLKNYGGLGIGWNDAKLPNYSIYNPQPTPGDDLKDCSETGYSYIGNIWKATITDNVLAEPVVNAHPVMIDDDTPLTQVKKVDGDWYIREDNSIYASGLLRSFDYGGSSYEYAVYARPYELFGRQAYWEPNDSISPYTTERVERIEVSKPHMAATVGETFTLTASVFPENTCERNITWRSSDPSVASVDGTGKVTVHGVGMAVIRAVSRTNSNVCGQCVLTVEEEAPVQVEMRQYPTKREFTTADSFSTTGGLLRLTYGNGQVRSLFVSPDFCSGYDLAQVGTQTVTVQFAGSTFTYSILVKEAEPEPEAAAVTGFAWLQYPERTQYTAGTPGELLSVDGGLLLVQYSDGSTAELHLTRAMCSGYDLAAAGEQTVDVTYKGFALSYTITVSPPDIGDIQLLTGTINRYRMDEVFVPHGVLIVEYTNGAQKQVPITADLCSAPDMHRVGIQTVDVYYAGQTLSYSIEILPDPDKIERISMCSLPRVLYYAGNYRPDEMDLTDGQIELHCTDGTSQPIPLTKDMIVVGASGKESISTSAQVTVEYAGRQTEFTVYDSGKAFRNKNLTAITLIAPPEKTQYTVGDLMAYPGGGGTVLLQFSDGTEYLYTVADLFEVPPSLAVFREPKQYVVDYYYRSAWAGSTAPHITITYTAVDESDAEDDPYAGLQESPYRLIWYRKPTKTVYCFGEALDTSGGQFEADTSVNIYSLKPDMCSGYDPMQSGWQTVTVSYTASRWDDGPEQTGTLTFDVFVTELVLENEVPEIEVGKCTRILATFQPMDIDGREIIWSSSNESIATVDEYGRVTGIAPGEVEITAQVKGSEAVTSCTVTVLPRTTERLPGDADGDGEVTLKDAAQILRYLAGGWGAVIDLENADVNRDGEVNLKDAVILRRYLAGGWEVKFN